MDVCMYTISYTTSKIVDQFGPRLEQEARAVL